MRWAFACGAGTKLATSATGDLLTQNRDLLQSEGRKEVVRYPLGVSAHDEPIDDLGWQ